VVILEKEGEWMQNNNILSCPFCGSELHKHYRYYHHEINGCLFDNYEFFKEDFDKWNTRKPMERILEQLEEHSSLEYLNRMEERVGKKQTQGFGFGVRCAYEIVKRCCR
jgi:hypothetical protein